MQLKAPYALTKQQQINSIPFLVSGGQRGPSLSLSLSLSPTLFSLPLPPPVSPPSFPPSLPHAATSFPFPFLVKKSQTGAGRRTLHQCWQESVFGSLCMCASSGRWNSRLSINNSVYTVYITHTLPPSRTQKYLKPKHKHFYYTRMVSSLKLSHTLSGRARSFSHWSLIGSATRLHSRLETVNTSPERVMAS